MIVLADQIALLRSPNAAQLVNAHFVILVIHGAQPARIHHNRSIALLVCIVIVIET